ncbi:MAG TPA: TatD family hydrolase [Saprospiraceae bacterium]|nr:TatD family hydrolase [Saprospiraceae bacterium]
MMLIDTHAHLYAAQFDEDRDEMMERAISAGVRKFFLPNIDSGSITGMLDLEKKYPGHCFAMMGLHPCSVNENYESELALVRSWLEKRSFSAVGEIGIDLYWDKTFVEEQKDTFLRQVTWAQEFDLPIVIHSRESIDLILDLLENLANKNKLRGVFHCFTGDENQAQRIMDLGFYMGIGGVLTFKKSGLDEVVKKLPMERLVLETDAPYLAPTPHRGSRNESFYIKLIAEKLAAVKLLSPEEVARITSQNAENLFGKGVFENFG